MLRPRASHSLKVVLLQSLNQHLSRSPCAGVGLGSLPLTAHSQPGSGLAGEEQPNHSAVHLGCPAPQTGLFNGNVDGLQEALMSKHGALELHWLVF